MSSQYKQPSANKIGKAALFCCYTLLLIIFIFPLSSCTKILTGNPTKLVQLHPQMPSVTISKSIPCQLLVNVPSAPAALAGDSITLLYNQREYKNIADVKWIDSLPNLLQSILVEAFETTRTFQNVASDSSGISGQIMLLSDVREFTLSYKSPNTAPTATIKIMFYLVDTASGNVISNLPLEGTETAKGTQLEDLMEAYDNSLEKILSNVVTWAAKTLENKNSKI